MKQQIKRLFYDTGAMLGAALVGAIVLFAGAIGAWIYANFS